MKKVMEKIGVSRLIVSLFLIALLVVLEPLGIDIGMSLNDILVRVGMLGFLVLAMQISVFSGSGLNFGLPIGILAGLLGGSIACQFDWVGIGGLLMACLISAPLAFISGILFGKILNRTKGSEMTVGNYLAFAMVYLMCIVWVVLPYSNGKIIWPMGGSGIRNTLSLDDYYSGVLDNFLKIDFKELGIMQGTIFENFTFPTGLLLVFAVGCLLVWLFKKSKAGIMMRCGGAYPGFAKALGINSSKVQTYGAAISMVFAAIGINIYSSSYGFYQFYTAPLKMAFPAIAALLIGGGTTNKATVFNVIFGLIIYQGLLTCSTPVVNALLNTGSISEVIRMIVQNGIILWALTKVKGQAR